MWAVYGVLAKASQDIHADMSEQFALGRELAVGYDKHPPLAVYVVRLWFTLFPAADWAYYLLASTNAALALWIIWRLCGRYLAADKRVLGLALLMLVPFFNFHALKFNANAILMPLWAATTLFFLRSCETRRVPDAALAGLCAAAAMYGKYWSAVLLLGLAIAALIDSRRTSYFRSPAPWVSALVGAAVLSPHLLWLVSSNFAPFSYAVFVHGQASHAEALGGALGYLAGSIGYVCVPLLITFVLARPTREALVDMVWPRDPARRLAAAAFWATWLLPVVVAPTAGVRLTSLWSMSAWTLLPVMLLSSPLVVIQRSDAAYVVASACALPLLMIAVAPAIAFAIHRDGVAAEAHSSLIAEHIDRLWRETSTDPLLVFASTDVFGYGVPFYLRSHPVTVHVLDRPATAQERARIAQNGLALACPIRAAGCIHTAERWAEAGPPGKRAEIDVARSFLGLAGSPARYLLMTIPPNPPPAHQRP
jgi:4-amino-4-deoxy-L-arabinose transferase-like glycosyltransferase